KAGKELRERVDLVGGNDEDAQSSGSSEPMPSMASLHAMH
ncbi:integration host factor subunit beta, partial [Achromobacter sp. AGC25]